jgi:cell division protein ZapA
MLHDAVDRVDTAMCKIRDAGKVKARDRIAVLASLNLAFELTQTQTQRPEPPLADTGPAAVGTTDWDDLLHRLDLALDSDGRLL